MCFKENAKKSSVKATKLAIELGRMYRKETQVAFEDFAFPLEVFDPGNKCEAIEAGSMGDGGSGVRAAIRG